MDRAAPYLKYLALVVIAWVASCAVTQKYAVSVRSASDASGGQGGLASNPDAAIAFVTQYVRAREGYSAHDVQENYEMVRLMSEPEAVYPAFVKAKDPANPASPAARLAAGGTAKIRFVSVELPKPQTAEVRFISEEKTNFKSGVAKNHTARLSFEYIAMNLTPEERLINPTGFRVTSYVRTSPK